MLALKSKTITFLLLSFLISGCTIRESLFFRNFLKEPATVTIRYSTTRTHILDSIRFANSITNIHGNLDQELPERLAGVYLNDSTIQFEVPPESTNFVYGSSPAGFWNLKQITVTTNSQTKVVFSEKENFLKKGSGTLLHEVQYFDLKP